MGVFDSFEVVLFLLVLVDSLFANVVAWGYAGWYKKRFSDLYKHLPLTKAWAFVYLLLVLWIGYLLFRLGVLVF